MNSSPRFPDFFIVGAPKCGTTSLYTYLRGHPDIFMPACKEPHFFGTDLFPPECIRDETRYCNLFSEAAPSQKIGEASVWQLYSRRAAQEIRACCPGAKIIIMLRNPVDMLYSLHSQRIFSGNEDIQDFEEALAAEKDRKRGLRLPEGGKHIEGGFYRDVARFSEQVRRFFDLFGKDNVFVIIFDDFKADPASVFSETLRFIGVDEGFTTDFRIINANKTVRFPLLREMLRTPPPLAKGLLKIVLPKQQRESLRGMLHRFNRRPIVRPLLPAEVRTRLLAEFAPDIRELADMTGKDLNHWLQAEETGSRGTPA